MVIIGQATQVRTFFANVGIQSVNWTVGNNPNRLYSLGTRAVYGATIPATNTFNVTVYGGVTDVIDYSGVTGCNNPGQGQVSVAPAACTGGGVAPPVTFVTNMASITSYSYTKDYFGHGTCTYNLTAYFKYPGALGNNVFADDLPDAIAVGMLEGTLAGDFGMDLLGSTSGAHMVAGSVVNGFTGNVQASAQSIGTYEQTWYGTFDKIGGGAFMKKGVKVTANVTIGQQAVYWST